MTVDTKDLIARLEQATGSGVPQCADFDDDCEDVTDKLHCWLYDPAKGMCPYLRARNEGEGA